MTARDEDSPAEADDPRQAFEESQAQVAGARWKKRLKAAVKIGLAIVLMGYLFKSGLVDMTRVETAKESPGLLALGCLLFTIPTFINSWRWQLLLRAAGFGVSWWRVFQLNHLGNFFNNFSLGSVGGDLVKAWYVVKSCPGARARAGLTVFVDRFIGLMAMIFLACLAGIPLISRIAEPEVAVLLGSVWALFLSMVVGAWVVSSRWLRGFGLVRSLLERLPGPFRTLEQALVVYREHPGKLAISFGLSLLTHTMMILGVLCLAWSLSVPEPIAHYIYLIPIGLFLNALPISFGSWGTGEIAWEGLFRFGQVDLGAITGAELCFLLHILMLFWSLSGGLIYLTYRHRQIDAAEPIAVSDQRKEV